MSAAGIGKAALLMLVTAGCNATSAVAGVEAPVAAAVGQERAFAADFDRFLSSSLRRLETIPGVAVAVTRSGGPIFVEGYGRADIARGLAATPDTRFYTGSSTKAFMGLTMALLERKGLADLDWTLAQLAPEIAFAPELRAGQVTLRHLLTHTHGLASWPIQFRLAYSGEHDPATLWRLLPQVAPNPEAPLGTYAYSNLGYNIAAMLVERRLKRRWQELVEAEVLRPLRMNQTVTRGLDRARATQPFAAPYLGFAPGGPELIGLLKVDSNMQSAGGLYSSARDLARWLTLHLAASRGARRLPLPADVVTATHRPSVAVNERSESFPATGYGLGWANGSHEGEPLYQSFGGYAGARSHLSFMPSRDLGVAIVTNDEGAGAPFIDVAAAYAYDWFAMGREAAERRAAAGVDRIAAQVPRITQRIAASRAEISARPWRLSLDRASYAGRFCSGAFGTIAVSVDGDGFNLVMGALRARAAPYTEPDSMRVEFIPYSGMPVKFGVQQGRVTALDAFGTSFQRCG